MYCPDCGLQNRDTAKFCTGCGVSLKEVAIGTVLGGRYRVDARLGHGGMGVVYRAWDVRLECACALKEMNAAGQTPDERAESVARFKREAQTLRGLSHPGLPKVYDFFDDGGRHFLVQDFIEGENFEAILARDGKPGLSESEVRALALAVLDILAYLHAQSPPVLHRDVKPANLMRRAGTGQVVLVDFGIARSHGGRTGTAIGTPEYCAPEQYTGKSEPASDVYALGATLHHLLTGAVPTPFQFAAPAGVSAELQGVLAKSTALNPIDRYASAEAMRQALGGTGNIASPQAGPASGGFLVAPPSPPVPVSATPLSSAGASVGSAGSSSVGAPPSAPASPPRPASPPTPATVAPTVVAPPSGGGRSSAAPAGAGTATRSTGAISVVLASLAVLCVIVVVLSPKPTLTSPGAAPVAATPVAATSKGSEGAARGATIVNPKDGMVLVRIPGGTYTIGSDTGNSDENPKSTVTLQPYAVGRCEVTNAQYRKFVQATGHRSAGDWERYAREWGEDCPVVNVSWHDANAYCAWAGLRLPTEAEWEVAARGPSGLEYPWGNDWDPAKCRSSVGGALGSAGQPVPVGSYPAGASPFGCLDMAGNVWEWCSSKYAPYPYDASDGREDPSGDGPRGLRGGSWDDYIPLRLRGANRLWSFPTDGDNYRGFRSARTL